MAKKDQTEALDPDTLRDAAQMAALNEASGGELFNAIDELRSSAGATGIFCIVNRIAPVEKKGYCGQLTVSEFSLEKMRHVYGAGRYMVQIKGPKGFLPGGGPVEIAETIEAPKGSGNDIATFLELMDRRDRERAAEKSEKMSRLTELGIPALTTIIAALVSRNTGPDITGILTALRPAPGPTLAEITATMANLKNLNGGDKAATDPIDQLIRVAEVVQKMGGTGGESKEGSSNWIDIVRDLVKEGVPMVKPMLDNIAASQARQAQSPPLQIQPLPRIATATPSIPRTDLPPANTAAPAESSVSVAETLGETDMMQLFLSVVRPQLIKVTQWAEKDYNPQTYAEVFLNEMPEIVANYLTASQALEYMTRADWFEKVCEFHPMLKQYQSWVTEFRDELIVLVTDMASDEPQPEKPKVVQPQIIDSTDSNSVE